MIAARTLALFALLVSSNAAWFNSKQKQHKQEQLQASMDVLMHVQDTLSSDFIHRDLQTKPEDTPCE
jgi:hypothetical protein